MNHHRKNTLCTALAAGATFAALPLTAQNPVVQTQFATDPAPMIYHDTLYVYTGHDEDAADFYWMYEWRIYSTTDMVNWTDHGAPLSLETFSWADDRAWASQCIERDGRFYWYVCAHSRATNTMAIGVATGDTPTGPFRDALGHPLCEGSWDYIDPTVWIDADGQAYLFFGNPHIYYLRLNPDMTSYSGSIERLTQTPQSFGAPEPELRVKGQKYTDLYTEGPWFCRRGENYYLLYAAGGVPEHIAYSMAPSPTGPWRYCGTIMPTGQTGSFTNHCGVIDFRGHSYFFYHTGRLPGGGGFGRSVSVEEFTYNADGTIPTILPTETGVSPIATLSPYGRVEAETMAFSRGVKSEAAPGGGVYLSELHEGDYVKVRSVDFGAPTAPLTFSASVASGRQGGQMALCLDSLSGREIARLDVPSTGSWESFRTVQTAVADSVSGVHDLYFVFHGHKGPKLFTFDWWRME
jgi:hypothetical protein